MTAPTAPPPGRDLWAYNRRIAAERLDWPDGALERCEKIDALNDGWYASWRHPYRDEPAGFYAHHDGGRRHERHEYGLTAGELQARISVHQCPPRR